MANPDDRKNGKPGPRLLASRRADKVKNLFQGILFSEGPSLGYQNLDARQGSLRLSIGRHKRDISKDLDPFNPQGTAYGMAGLAADQDKAVCSVGFQQPGHDFSKGKD